MLGRRNVSETGAYSGIASRLEYSFADCVLLTKFYKLNTEMTFGVLIDSPAASVFQ